MLFLLSVNAINFIKFIQYLLDWSEVWALLIPLYVVIAQPKQPAAIKPVMLYLWLALALNVTADIIGSFKAFLPSWAQSNNPLYNVHSVVRFACFGFFFISLEKKGTHQIHRVVALIMVLFLLVNFTFFENFFHHASLSGNLLTIESYLLLVFCMLYYLSRLRNEDDRILKRKDFWIVTGLSMYVVINFFIFLFYQPMLQENATLARQMWNVHNVAFIIFCILIAKALYVPDSN